MLLASGATIPISEIEVGDYVLATDPDTGETSSREVTNVIVGSGDKEMVDIQVGGKTISATDKHPFFVVEEDEWKDAEDLEVGDILRRPDGTLTDVETVSEYTLTTTVYNLTVEGLHTYYAGEALVLVHNCSAAAQPRDAFGRFTRGAGGDSAAAAAGRSAHNVNYQNTLGGGDYVFNRRMPGSLDRPDAVSYSQRIVRELKPDNPKAIAKGRRRVNEYKAYLEETTGDPWTAYVDVYKR